MGQHSINAIPSSTKTLPEESSTQPRIALKIDWAVERAKAYSSNANLCCIEETMYLNQFIDPTHENEVHLAKVLLANEIDKQANISAAAAVNTFIRLEECQLRLALLTHTQKLLSDLLAVYKEIEARDEYKSAEVENIEMQIGEVLCKSLHIESERAGLQLLATRQLGVDPDVAKDLSVSETIHLENEFDEGNEVAIAIRNRADIKSAEFLFKCGSRKTLPILRAFIAQFDPFLGKTPPPIVDSRWHCGKALDNTSSELQMRKKQLRLIIDRRKAETSTEIVGLIRKIGFKAAEYSIAENSSEDLRTRIVQLRDSNGLSGVTPVQIAKAELDLVKLNERKIDQEVSWKLLIAELRSVQQSN